MSEYVIDGLYDASEGFDPLPIETLYEVIFTGVTETTSQQGNPTVAIEATVQNSDGYDGRKLFANIALIPQMRSRLKQLWIACGLTVNESDKIDPVDLENACCRVRLSLREYNGEMKNEIKRFLPLEG